jgi:hypothetical protein
MMIVEAVLRSGHMLNSILIYRREFFLRLVGLTADIRNIAFRNHSFMIPYIIIGRQIFLSSQIVIVNDMIILISDTAAGVIVVIAHGIGLLRVFG